MNTDNVSSENETSNVILGAVVCSCYMCGKDIETPEAQFDMYGEIVCQNCWDYNMYQALQDAGGM